MSRHENIQRQKWPFIIQQPFESLKVIQQAVDMV